MVVVDDVTKSPIFVGTISLTVMLEAGVRAVQSTPLVSRSGRLIGVISTHYSERFIPNDSDLEMFDSLVCQTVDRLTIGDGTKDPPQDSGNVESQMENESADVKALSNEIIDRKIAEVSADIDFLERQVDADLDSYSTDDLSSARNKIASLRQKLVILKIEFARRQSNIS